MVRALWTGASGMNAQQVSLDNIANNLANVNTTGYKKQTTEFSSLLYQKLQRTQTDNNGDPKPVLAQVGTGVRVTALTSIFTQGIMQETGNERVARAGRVDDDLRLRLSFGDPSGDQLVHLFRAIHPDTPVPRQIRP